MSIEKEIRSSVNRLMDAFSTFKPDPDAMKGFTNIVVEKLSQFPAFIIGRAVEKLIETQQFFPKINEMMAACYGERDDVMRVIANKHQDFKDDWRTGKIHTRQEWESLRDRYLKVGCPTSAAYVMESFEDYKNPCGRIKPEQWAEYKKKMATLVDKMESN